MGDSITDGTPQSFNKGDDAGTHEVMTRACSLARVALAARDPVFIALSAFRSLM